MSDSAPPPFDDASGLAAQLRDLGAALRRQMRERWSRDLPFDELLFDRWERARSLGFGAHASIYHNSYVYGDVTVGEHTWIGPFTVLEGAGGIRIGRHCSISAGVQIYTHDSVRWALSGRRAPYDRAPVTIGDCTYVGSQTVIAKGVTIGDHVVIGACSFVNRSIPPFRVAARSAVPCHRPRRRRGRRRAPRVRPGGGSARAAAGGRAVGVTRATEPLSR